MENSILVQIQNNYISFSEKEKMIAKYIIANSRSIKNINITELSKKVGTSNATITRFCKKIGCENFVEMKMQLCLDSSEEEEVDSNNIFEKVHSYYTSVIGKTKEVLNKEIILKFINKIKTANRIFVYGIGSSSLTAMEMKYRFQRMGINIDAITDPHIMLMNSSLVNKNDLVIGISNSGFTKEIINGLDEAKKNKAFVVAITSFKESPITKCANLSIITYNTKLIGEKNFINSQLSIIYLLDILSMILMKEDEFSNCMERTLEQVHKYK